MSNPSPIHVFGDAVARPATSMTGALTAFAGGLVSGATEGPAAWVSLVVAIGGLTAAFASLSAAAGPNIVAILKLWADQKREDRAAKFERHELANKLHVATLRIADLERTIDALERWKATPLPGPPAEPGPTANESSPGA